MLYFKNYPLQHTIRPGHGALESPNKTIQVLLLIIKCLYAMIAVSMIMRISVKHVSRREDMIAIDSEFSRGIMDGKLVTADAGMKIL